MGKIEFSKIEAALTEALRQSYIQRLSELAVLAHLVRGEEGRFDPQKRHDIFLYFQEELRKLQKKDPGLYRALNVSKEVEERLLSQQSSPHQTHWCALQDLQKNLQELKKQLQGSNPSITPDQETQIEQERKKHIYKRFNVKEGWLPLH